MDPVGLVALDRIPLGPFQRQRARPQSRMHDIGLRREAVQGTWSLFDFVRSYRAGVEQADYPAILDDELQRGGAVA